MIKLHLGCGNDYKKGWINCDISKKVKTDMRIDLEKPLPFADNFVDKIRANHILEHIKNLDGLLNEINRVCKKGSIMKIKVPFYTHYGAFMDPTHKRFFTPFTFDYFTDLFDIEKIKLRFIYRESIFNKIINPIANLNHRIYCRFFANIFPMAEIYFELKVRGTKND